MLTAEVDALTDLEAYDLLHDWKMWARPEQLPPTYREWTYWLILAGRGWGKTRTGGEWVREQVKIASYVNLIGATVDDARDIMIEGESGILAICPADERPLYKKNDRKLVWPNGATSLIFTADEPDRLRGKQHEKFWADEVASWRYPESWTQAQFGLRLGTNPQACITTTPQPTALIKELVTDEATVITRGTTYDNRINLAKTFFSKIIRSYEGTRLGRQELQGEILDDNPKALWKRWIIDKYRIKLEELPALSRIVVAIDPAVTSNPDSDWTGIVVAGIGRDNKEAYVLADVSVQAQPLIWAKTAIYQLELFMADLIVAEVNNGGDLVETTLRTVNMSVPYKKIHASRGKVIRAEPISALYEQGRVHHVGFFPELEDQMCDYDPVLADRNKKSPDRMDALVWAATELALNEVGLATQESMY